MSETFVLLSPRLRAEFLRQNLNWVCIDKMEDFLNTEKQVRKEKQSYKQTLPSPPSPLSLNSLNNIDIDVDSGQLAGWADAFTKLQETFADREPS